MKATAFVNIPDALGTISPLIYGQFIEHLGRCIYGGLWVGEDSKIPNIRGFRRDVMEAVKAIRPGIVRYPGGNFASAYHWQDGVGPRAERPRRWDPTWKCEESNHVGTDEFIDWCGMIQAQPYLCVNAGNGSAEEAARWVEYCNLAKNTSHAAMRVKNGHAKPHDVRYWSIGNELYGEWQIGHMGDGKECARRTRDFAHAMSCVDPTIEMIGVGTRHDPQWNWDMVTGSGKWLKHLSVHCYIHLNKHTLPELLAAPDYFAQILGHVSGTIAGARRAAGIAHPIRIALDEWNLWYHEIASDNDPGSHLGQNTSLKDALFTASVFNVFHRNCDILSMANYALTVNGLPLIYTHPTHEGMYFNPQYLAFLLYSNRTGEQCVRNHVVCDGYSSEAKSFYGENCKASVPYLDLSTSWSPGTRTLYLHAVNRSEKDAVECDIQLRGAEPTSGTAHVLAGDHADARND
nr:alpha-N-arabinofuranosidase [Planctomycetota bacterium]